MLEAQHFRTVRTRIVDQRLAIVDPGNDEVAAVTVGSDGGQRGGIQAAKRAARGLGLEAQLLGGDVEFGTAEAAAIFGEFVSELFGGGGYVMKTRQHDQTGKACVDLRRNAQSLEFVLHFIPLTRASREHAWPMAAQCTGHAPLRQGAGYQEMRVGKPSAAQRWVSRSWPLCV
ncbi:hypothetical protein D3C76_518180 [compost metagenome]